MVFLLELTRCFQGVLVDHKTTRERITMLNNHHAKALKVLKLILTMALDETYSNKI
jgi:hypothetical protein